MKQVSIACTEFMPDLPKSIHKRGLFFRYRFILLFGVLAMAAGCQKSPGKKIVPLYAEFTTVSTIFTGRSA